MPSWLPEALRASLGGEVADLRAVAGGDVNVAFRARLADGRRVFVKCAPQPRDALREAFLREAEGLGWLASAQALPLPAVLHATAGGADAPPHLVLEWIEAGAPRADFDEVLGRGLAALHRSGAPGFGLEHDNFIGPLPQPNADRPSWPVFYREQRLVSQLRRARDAGRLEAAAARRFDALLERLEERVGAPEPPARLHGDLWSGNLLVDESGAPCLIDPAVYGGHREMDLAMMRLFGGFSPRCFAAYRESFPLASGHEERVALYQLYPLLVHVNLFGGGYRASLEATLDDVL